MTTLEFMERELNNHVLNLARQEKRGAPSIDIEHIKIRIEHYKKVCEVLRKEARNETTEG